ncbi:MAG TPA: GNAT family N-acetyltransferase [Xenococcaceae cyanobacterium]
MLSIRQAQLEDIETLFEIRTSVKENYQSRAAIAKLGITPETVAQMLQKDCRAWIAEISGKAIAFSLANATKKTIFGMFVLPEFEGRGAGRALMHEAETWLFSHNIAEIWLVTGNNPKFRAYGFYLHLGWIPVGVEPNGVMKFIKKQPLI